MVANPDLVGTSAPAQPTPASQLRQTVLVADDDAPVREVLSRLLARLGFRVLAAADGREAVDALGSAQAAIDLVLLDFRMPTMDGEAAFQEIRRLRPEVPVIFLSGGLEESRIAEYRQQGLAGALAKPVTLARLREAVTSALTSAPH
jgi:two-component system, cell cycle sensor histidine kinase and response regulator CckA